MNDLCIYLGNKNYSSWSLRAWLPLKQTGVPFQEVIIPLFQASSREQLHAHSPSGRVPVLTHGELTIWESLAIAEYLAETFPVAQLWPSASAARAVARAVSAEMHAGFAALRTHLPMDMRQRYPGREWPVEVSEDIRRIVELWTDCRRRFGTGGDFLFGTFGIADAMYAPVVSRFVTYGVELDGIAAAYRDAIWAWPALKEWVQAAEAEPWTITV
ncbi:MAG TPA: glutathione S-transferase family protein [Candidatus Competibacteraceae bacterium]|nr:glutathione S-transferase family protein [Candidatus Competibacteraceae bacterium]